MEVRKNMKTTNILRVNVCRVIYIFKFNDLQKNLPREPSVNLSKDDFTSDNEQEVVYSGSTVKCD